VPAAFEDPLAIVEELLREVERMEEGEKRIAPRGATSPCAQARAQAPLACPE